jgi:small subunit ribosomal protein S4
LNLETRLDNIVYRLGFGISRRESRQLVSHGHILVNEKPVNIPSYKVRVGDTIAVREKSKKNTGVTAAMASAQSRLIPEWLALDKDNVKGMINALPTREQLAQTIRDQLIVELYSK